MVKIAMRGATPHGSASQCDTCSSSQVMIGYRESERITLCNYPAPSMVIPFSIYECSNYHDKNRPTWKQMQDLALEIDTGPLKPVGFKTGAGFQASVRLRPAVEDDDDDDE